MLLLLAVPSLAHRVGVNFALKLQVQPLANDAAARILKAKFPQITKAKIFDSDAAVIDALRAEGVNEVVLAVPNFQVSDLGSSTSTAFADNLVEQVVAPRVALGMKLTVAIGNEPFATWNNLEASLLERAYRNLRASLAARNLATTVKITIPFYFGIMASTYPPTAGAFATSRTAALTTLATLLFEDSSTFDINIYPFFSHRDNPTQVGLDYALGNEGHTVGGVTYGGLLQAQVAAVRAALLKLDARFTAAALPIVVGETGWPTAGHASATAANAAVYAKNAVDSGLSMYLFEAFDEKKKSADGGAGSIGAAVEDNWGIFTEAGAAKYSIAALEVALPPSTTTATPSPAPSPSSPSSSLSSSPSPGNQGGGGGGLVLRCQVKAGVGDAQVCPALIWACGTSTGSSGGGGDVDCSDIPDGTCTSRANVAFDRYWVAAGKTAAACCFGDADGVSNCKAATVMGEPAATTGTTTPVTPAPAPAASPPSPSSATPAPETALAGARINGAMTSSTPGVLALLPALLLVLVGLAPS